MSTPMETNTEELREILQTVYNLPDARSGSVEPDLVIHLNLDSEKYGIDQMTSDDLSFTGDFAAVKAKLLNHEDVSVVMKHGYHYADHEFTGTALPLQVGYNVKYDNLYAEFIMGYYPGENANHYFLRVTITAAGDIDGYVSTWIRTS